MNQFVYLKVQWNNVRIEKLLKRSEIDVSVVSYHLGRNLSSKARLNSNA